MKLSRLQQRLRQKFSFPMILVPTLQATTFQPSNHPTIQPFIYVLSCQPITLLFNHPTMHSTIQPSNHSTIQPFNHFKHLTIQPSNYPIIQPYSVKLYQLTSRRSATWYLERSSEMSHVSVAISCSRRADWVRLVCRASRAFMQSLKKDEKYMKR